MAKDLNNTSQVPHSAYQGGEKMVVVSSNGQLKTLPIDDILGTIGAGEIPYTTLAAATAAGAPPLDANGYRRNVRVLGDSTADNNGLYYWHGSALVKSGYDPVSQAKTIAKSKIAEKDLLKTLIKGKNLFNKDDEDYEPNKYVKTTNGETATPSPKASAYSATGFINVTPGMTYTRSASHNGAFYDANKNFVSGISALGNIYNSEAFTVPENCHFVRLTIPENSLKYFQFEEGGEKTSFEEWGYYVDGKAIKAGAITGYKIASGSVSGKQTDFMVPGKNLFNKNDEGNLEGFYIQYGNGSEASNSSYNATHFIEVEPGKTYAVSYSHQRAFYDSGKKYVSGENSGSPKVFTVPAGCNYVRLTVSVSNWEYFQVEAGSENTDFSEYGFKIKESAINSPAKDSSEVQNPVRPERLRQTRMRLTKLGMPAPESTQLVIAAGGDSYTHNPGRWIRPVTDMLAEKYGDAGGGWCGFGFLTTTKTAPWTNQNQPNYVQGNARPGRYPIKHYGSGSGKYRTGNSPDLATVTLTKSGDSIHQGMPESPIHSGCKLFYVASEDGEIRYSWDGGVSWTSHSLNTDTAGELQIAPISAGLPAGAGTLMIEWVAGVCELCGVNLISEAPGVRVNKLAATGSRVESWASAGQGFEAALTEIGAHLWIFMDGTNSQSAGVSSSAWQAQMGALLDRVKTALPAADQLIMTPPENQRTTNVLPMKNYAEKARDLTKTKWCCFNDTQLAFGSAENPNEYGAAGAIPLYNADLIHPDPETGGRVLVAEVMKLLRV